MRPESQGPAVTTGSYFFALRSRRIAAAQLGSRATAAPFLETACCGFVDGVDKGLGRVRQAGDTPVSFSNRANGTGAKDSREPTGNRRRPTRPEFQETGATTGSYFFALT